MVICKKNKLTCVILKQIQVPAVSNKTVWRDNKTVLLKKKKIWGLVGFYGISTIVGYLIPNLVFIYILNDL